MRLYQIIQDSPNSILLETVKPGREGNRSFLFTRPLEIIIAHSLGDIFPAFQRIELMLSKGYYIAGYLTYECGAHFEDIPLRMNSPGPLLWFGVYSQPSLVERKNIEKELLPEKYDIGNIRFSISETGSTATSEEYTQKINRIKKHIREGDVYQINFTGRMNFRFTGSTLALYNDLTKKQRVSYAAYIRTDRQTILSLSPELFFKKNGNDIIVRPMKGTAKRGRTLKEDREMASWLAADKKNRAENVMIVDVLRNDVGKIAETGTVMTTSLYEVEQYDTLFQMTSTVKAKLRKNVTYYDLFNAFFPSGSITGAPKRRAMELISDIETTPRGIYTGTIGYIAPNGEAEFNIAIRTVIIQNPIPESRHQSKGCHSDPALAGEESSHKTFSPESIPCCTAVHPQHNEATIGVMGTGGGIVWDSKADDELRECELKAQFLSLPYQEFQLIETMLWQDGFPFLDLHLKRLNESCEYFDFPYDENEILIAIHNASRRKRVGTGYKVRLSLNRFGKVEIQTSIVEPTKKDESLFVRIANRRTDSSDRFLFHKTTYRRFYDDELMQAKDDGLADVIFLNERDEVTEGAISNVFIKKGDRYITPPVECGLLDGVYRRHFLMTQRNVQEKILTLNDVKKADAIFICNAVRGMREVKLIDKV